jgi:hypothetical protein
MNGSGLSDQGTTMCAHLFQSPSWLGRYIKARGGLGLDRTF